MVVVGIVDTGTVVVIVGGGGGCAVDTGGWQLSSLMTVVVVASIIQVIQVKVATHCVRSFTHDAAVGRGE